MTDVGRPSSAELAVQIWQAEGCQADKDLEYWLRAEKIKKQLGEEIKRAVERSRLRPQINQFWRKTDRAVSQMNFRK